MRYVYLRIRFKIALLRLFGMPPFREKNTITKKNQESAAQKKPPPLLSYYDGC